MKNILEKKAKKFIKLSTDREIKKYAYKWVLFVWFTDIILLQYTI